MKPYTYSLAELSQKNRDKTKNGDFFATTKLHNTWVIATIADGVGSRPCDWLAAQTACQKFIESLSLPLLPDSWEHSIRIIDQIVSNPPEECKGMMTTFVAVVWNLYENYVEFVNIGDSRVYLVKKNQEVIQLTKDDTKAVNLRDKNGKLLLSGGYTITRMGLSNCLGLQNATFEPQKTLFEAGDTLILATDGFYADSKNFEADCQDLAQNLDLSSSLAKLFRFYHDHQKDDMTAVVLRNNGQEINSLELPTNLDTLKAQFTNHQIIEILFAYLQQAIAQKNTTQAEKLLDWAILENITFTKQILEDLLQEMTKQAYKEWSVYNKMMVLLRKVMKNL